MSGRQQQLALLPADPPRWGGRALEIEPLRTSGQLEYVVHCDGPGGCGAFHRHVRPGTRRGPCGAEYLIPDAGELVGDTS